MGLQTKVQVGVIFNEKYFYRRLSLSTVVLNSMDCQGKLRLPQKCAPKKQP